MPRVHEPLVFALKAIRVADTAPLELVEPLTTAQRPTCSAAWVVATVVVYFVADVTWTEPVEVVGAVDALDDEPGSRPTVIVTVIVEPDTEVTLPAIADPKAVRVPRPGAPEGRAPVGNPLGRAPRPPVGGPPPAPPAGPPQLPLVADAIRTAVAVMLLTGDALVEPLAAVATTQLPTCTAARVVAFSVVNAVFAEYVTAVCSVLLWT
jgi:hypothetical protein